MPEWSAPPETKLDDLLDQAWHSLHEIVEKQPPMEEVTGVPMEQMMAHAKQAAESYIAFNAVNPLPQEQALMQVYCLGFVVGTTYGELRHAGAAALPD